MLPHKLLVCLSVCLSRASHIRCMPHLAPKTNPQEIKSQRWSRTYRHGLSFLLFPSRFAFVSIFCPRPSSPSRSQASGSALPVRTSTHHPPSLGTCRPCRLYMWAAHGARSPGPPRRGACTWAACTTRRPPLALGGTSTSTSTSSGSAASRFRCSTELPYSPSRDGLSYLTKFLFFRLFRLFLFSSSSAAPLRRKTPRFESNHARRREWTRDRGRRTLCHP